jgi:hypothetical protein
MSWNKCNVVMLSTKDAKAPILSYLNDKSIQYFPGTVWSNSDLTKRHLYITSNEEIKSGDKCYNSYDGQIWEYRDSPCPMPYWGNKDTLKKIIATTDTSLGIALIPEQFINYFIKEYNKGNVIKEVLVEYEEYEIKQIEWFQEAPYTHKYKELKIKLNSDNTINIKPIKDSWSREEVVKLLKSMPNFFKISIVEQIELRDKWIKENL